MTKNTLRPNTEPIDEPKKLGAKDALWVGGATALAAATGLFVPPAALSALAVGPAVWAWREHLLNKGNTRIALVAIFAATENASVATRNLQARPTLSKATDMVDMAQSAQADAEDKQADAEDDAMHADAHRENAEHNQAKAERDRDAMQTERDSARSDQAHSDELLLSDLTTRAGIRVPAGASVDDIGTAVIDELNNRQSEVNAKDVVIQGLNDDLATAARTESQLRQEKSDLERQLAAAQASASSRPQTGPAAPSGTASQADLDQARDDLVDAQDEIANLTDELAAALAEVSKLAAAGSAVSTMDHYVQGLAEKVSSDALRERIFAAALKFIEDGGSPAGLVNKIEN